ncbi:MAG: helix-turn-helix domain-containing protein [Candidatus Aminicenantes bacterium]|nr:helix-turn-helix domain-containing protein [Candidatus Aminicenantes bacterium]NIN16897.1 helix-turn-helix domain-containing protein [Candidatus Aminicenantes bacterium]NIN40790.1 helix-turn-helix domain-containing protein [Candidatus Aminicenantes bacterium]NIN83594.1 helix-turn-helix domain-containing protein [Candidatus Aminicenantes bacterium]NIO79489.1 helix-turn-helix domain-containing protein [Candidatus Aminicenantes bacterium]
MNENSLGERIFKLRKAAKMSQHQLAKQLDIHQKNISKYERNEYTPSALIVRDIAKVFGVTTDYLLFGSEAGTREGVIHVKDRQLAQELQELDNLDEETRQVVIGLLRLAIKSNKAKKLLSEV